MMGFYGPGFKQFDTQDFRQAAQNEGIPATLVEKFLSLVSDSHQCFAVDLEKALSLLQNCPDDGESLQISSILRVSKIKFPGTDGMRGLVSGLKLEPLESLQQYRTDGLLTPMFCYVMVRAFVKQLHKHAAGRSSICIGEDGRDASSGHPLLPSLIAAVEDEGMAVEFLGIVPTPAVAAFSLVQGCGGIMITASHNPAAYNGIKFFIEGRKLYPDGEMGEYALSLQALQLASSLGKSFQIREKDIPVVVEGPLGLLTDSVVEDLDAQEIAVLRSSSITLDCAHGAVSTWYEDVFQKMGLFIEVLNAGIAEGTINEGCGAAVLDGMQSIKRQGPYPLALARRMIEKQTLDNKTQFGIAVDGDGDRGLVLVLQPGSPEFILLHGDEILLLLVKRLKDRGRETSVVSLTIESDPRTGHALKRVHPGIEVLQRGVGDRWLTSGLEAGLLCGAEDSGHVIQPVKVGEKLLYSGNGLATGLVAVANYSADVLVSAVRTGVCKTVVKPVDTRFWYEGSGLFEQVRHFIEGVFAQDIERMVCEEDSDILAYRFADAGILYARASGTEPKLQLVHPNLDDNRFEKVSQAFRMACGPFQK